MTDVPLSAPTRLHIQRLFPESDWPQVESLLIQRCGNGLPFCQDGDPTSLERIRFAALKVSNGNMAALHAAVALAETDWRDLLVDAGFAHDVRAHQKWASG